MNLSNPWFLLALVATVGLFHIGLIATLLNMSALKPEPPAPLRSAISDDTHQRSLEYARVSGRFDITESSIMLGLTLAFWWSGGFGWAERVIAGLHLTPLMHGLVVIGVMYLAAQVVSLPFDAWDTFVIEREFGFNKTTPLTFVADRLKGLALAMLLGLPVTALLLWLFATSSLAALYGWIAVSAFSLAVAFAAPRLIMPLFFKFAPLADTALREKIMHLSQRLRFPVADVNVVDGSRRSTKANAFFAGFGKTKRIALYDTLLQNHSHEEIVAVLAHEIGHHQRGHVPRQIALGLALSALMFAMLHFAVRDARLCAAFGVRPPTVAWSLVFFSIVYQPVNLLAGLLGSHLSRKYEFEADAFAKDATGSAAPMTQALTKLSLDHLSNLTPHPFYVFLHYSHPPVLRRLEALKA